MSMSEDKAAGRPRARSVAKAASRDALIAAAIKLMPEKGLDVSLDELCTEAGYTRGAYYQHFKDREALIAAVMAQVGEQVVSVLMGSGASGTPEDLMSLVARLVAMLARDDYPVGKGGLLRTHQLLEACVRSPVVRTQYMDLLSGAEQRVGGALSAAQQQGRLRDDIDAAALAQLALAAFIGLRTLRDLEYGADLPMVAATLLRLVSSRHVSSE